nr:MAG TPA: hypothetical protein [Caudoviricetes sp.]
MAEGIQIENLPSTTTVKQNDTMTIVQDKENKQLPLDRFANESDLKTLAPLETRCDEVKAKIEVDEYSAEITTSQSMSEIGSDDSGANLHENVLDGAFESCVLKGHTKYRDIDTGEILENFEESRNLELITVRMPILTTTGKNLVNKENLVIGVFDSNKLMAQSSSNRLTFNKNNAIKVKPNTNYTISYATGYKSGLLGLNATKTSVTINSGWKNTPNGYTFTTDANTHYVTFNISKTDDSIIKQSDKDTLNLIVEQGTVATPYEPYKSSILSLPEEVVLRSLPDGTCDTLNVETGEYVQKIGERNYQDGDTNSNTLVTDGTKTHYKLSSPIITKVDVQGFPHAYKNGHIQLSSGSTEPSLTPTVTYKVPVSRVGQIASNTKSNLRQTIKLDQLEILAYQSLINAEYENLLVQNSAESAASFTNLSTNDPKDELYYMLKRLIEEDQPVQNMLDKINLFYLYGLLSDEHYFDLLLGGEEDVY